MSERAGEKAERAGELSMRAGELSMVAGELSMRASELSMRTGELSGEAVVALAETDTRRRARGATRGPRDFTGCLRVALIPAISVANTTRRFAGDE